MDSQTGSHARFLRDQKIEQVRRHHCRFFATACHYDGGTQAGARLCLEEIDPCDLALFVLPGGDMWQEKSHKSVKTVLCQLHEQSVPIGAICAATLEIARAGLTHGIHHTSNSKHYLKAMVQDYRDEALYVDKLAVSDSNIITASGLGSVEFARGVIRGLVCIAKLMSKPGSIGLRAAYSRPRWLL